jgi:hypothetical protein
VRLLPEGLFLKKKRLEKPQEQEDKDQQGDYPEEPGSQSLEHHYGKDNDNCNDGEGYQDGGEDSKLKEHHASASSTIKMRTIESGMVGS